MGPRTTVELTGLDKIVDADTVDEHEERAVAHEIATGINRVVGSVPELDAADVDVNVDITVISDSNEGE